MPQEAAKSTVSGHSASYITHKTLDKIIKTITGWGVRGGMRGGRGWYVK